MDSLGNWVAPSSNDAWWISVATPSLEVIRPKALYELGSAPRRSSSATGARSTLASPGGWYGAHKAKAQDRRNTSRTSTLASGFRCSALLRGGVQRKILAILQKTRLSDYGLRKDSLEVDRTFGLWKEHRRRFPCSDLKRGLAKTNTKFTVV